MNEGCLEITWQDLEELQEGDYQLVDIRGAFSAAYGVIPGAVNIPQEELSERVQELPEDKKLILYCTRGMFQP